MEPPIEPRAPTILDLNANGLPDYQEPAVWRWLWVAVRAVVRATAPTHTLVRRGVEALDREMHR
jgi:hypothetical protein